jgi:hypothetical protein
LSTTGKKHIIGIKAVGTDTKSESQKVLNTIVERFCPNCPVLVDDLRCKSEIPQTAGSIFELRHCDLNEQLTSKMLEISNINVVNGVRKMYVVSNDGANYSIDNVMAYQDNHIFVGPPTLIAPRDIRFVMHLVEMQDDLLASSNIIFRTTNGAKEIIPPNVQTPFVFDAVLLSNFFDSIQYISQSAVTGILCVPPRLLGKQEFANLSKVTEFNVTIPFKYTM